ncbi:MAG: carbohydrate binding domain-containing protein [Firmicutes bacterium]|nr:carbohydrate binding domain-containing protein [Bacillota bacterium]
MKKRIIVLALVMMFGFFLVSCTPDEEPIVPTLTSIVISGADDVTLAFEANFNILDGVTALGNDSVDYTADITYVTTSAVLDGDVLNTSVTGNHAIRYEVSVDGIVAQHWRYITVTPPQAVEGEMLVNPDFANGTAGWDSSDVVYNADGSSMTLSTEDGALKAEVVAGTNVYTPRFGQMNVPFEQGKAYKVSFDAKASVEKIINLQVGELLSGAPYFTDFKPGQTEHRTITTEWANYEYSFMMTLDNPRGGVLFELGAIGGVAVDGTLWFDNILIEETTITGDSVLPAISGVKATTNILIDSTFDPLTGVTASDNIDGDITASIEVAIYSVVGEVETLVTTIDTSAEAVYRIVYTVSDAAGNETVAETVATIVLQLNWVGYGMTVVESDTDVTITYTATPESWWNNNAQLEVSDFDGTKDAVLFTFTGVADQEYLFKIEGGGAAKELAVIADGTEQELLLDLASMTEAQRDGLNLIIVFVKTLDAAGTLVVNNWEYGPSWIGYGLTVVETATDVSITYTATPASWWNNNAQLKVVNFDGTQNQVQFTFTGVLGTEYLFKIEGGGQAAELGMVADGTEQVLLLPLTTMTEVQRNGLNLIIVFVKTEGAAGTVVVNDWTYGPVVETVAPVWTDFGIAVVETETEVTLTYTSTPTEWWNNNARLAVVGFDGTKNQVVFTFTGVAGEEYVFKIEGGGQALELTVAATGASQQAVLDLSAMTQVQREGLNLLVVFSKTIGASGTLVITDVEYTVATT